MGKINRWVRLSLLSLLSLLGLAAATPARAQSAEEKAVLDVVVRLFDGMRAADSAMVRSVFHPEARLVTASARDGQPLAAPVPIDRFVQAVAGFREKVDEQIHDPEIRVDGNLAQLWTFYTLHVDGRFVHCGVDAFQLVRTAAGWKIIQIADTRRREGCERPAGR